MDLNDINHNLTFRWALSLQRSVRISVIELYHELIFFEALSSAEMSAFKPVAGGFVRHANMWLSKSFGITTG